MLGTELTKSNPCAWDLTMADLGKQALGLIGGQDAVGHDPAFALAAGGLSFAPATTAVGATSAGLLLVIEQVTAIVAAHPVAHALSVAFFLLHQDGLLLQ